MLEYTTGPDAARWRPRRAFVVGAVVCVVLLLYGAAGTFGRGGRGFFSPDTLDCKTQSEWLLPFTELPLYRGPASTHRWPIVNYLVAEGYWAPTNTSDPRWLSTFHWNEQWRDGQSRLHRELAWNGREWITWSKSNPEMAKVVWPKVLKAMRSGEDGARSDAEDILMAAQYARTAEELEALLAP